MGYLPIWVRTFVFVVVLTLVGLVSVGANAQFLEKGKTSPESVPGAPTVNTAEAKALYDEGAAFIDVRSQMMWDGGHIPESVLIPIKEFTKETLMEVAEAGDPIVVYCQGIKCARSAKACKKALSWGYSKVYYYREGYPGWKDAGYPVE